MMMYLSNTKITKIYDLKLKSYIISSIFILNYDKIDRKQLLMPPNSNYQGLRKDYRGSP